MRHCSEGLTLICVLLVFVFGNVGSAEAASQADERAALQLIRASHLAATGRCAEAMSVAEASPARDAAAERLIGKCAIQAKRYTKALFSLNRAGEMDPSLTGVSLYRAIALYHLGDYPGARAALDDARGVGEEAAYVEFYSGLLLLREDRPRESALAFERAAVLGPHLVEPVASYYAALAWQSLNENEPLTSAADRVVNEDPDSAWALEARNLLELQAVRHRAGQTELQRWASLKAGVEYDSNVVLRGTSVALPSNISSDNDVLGVWSLTLGAELFEINGYTTGAMVNYRGNAHDDVGNFDQHDVSAMGWVDREFRPTTLGRLRITAGYGWFDGDPFVVHLDFTGLVEERWGKRGTTRCTLGVEYADYRYDIDLGLPSVTKQYKPWVDQDGAGLKVGCDHELSVGLFEGVESFAYGGYHFTEYFADGRVWDHDAHEIQLGLRVKLLLNIDLDVSGTYTRRDYHIASYWANDPPYSPIMGPDREDNSFRFDVDLAREFSDRIEISARYQYTDNGSSTKAFDYERHIVGMYVELKFP